VKIEKLATGLGFVEGPVHLQGGGMLVTSVDRGHLYRLEDDGEVHLHSVPGGGPNGATEGSNGGIFVAQNKGFGPDWRRPSEHGGVQVVTRNGHVDFVTTDPIAPNDLCFGPDGLLYTTDPNRDPDRWDDGRIWRCDIESGDAELIASVGWYPNGIAFGPEDDAFYVANMGKKQILRWSLDNSARGVPEVYIQLENGFPDGFAFDVEGNVWIATAGLDEAPGNVQIWDRDGRLTEEINFSDSTFITNVAIDGTGRAIITDADSGTVWSIPDAPYAGLALHPFRT
jgi:gluconolactonase